MASARADAIRFLMESSTKQGVAKKQNIWHDRYMKIGEFELADPLPELNRPIAIAMLRPWIDVGRVGTLSLNILQRHLGAQELGRLAEPGKFFDFTRYRPRMRTVNGERVFTTPNSIIHYAHDDSTDRDYLFLHVREPHNFGETYCSAISEVLSYFDIQEYCRIGGMYDSVPHTRPLLVTGTMSDEQAAKARGLVSQRRSTYQGSHQHRQHGDRPADWQRGRYNKPDGASSSVYAVG